jgi:peroxin-12
VLQAALWGRGDAEDVQFLETDNLETRTPSGNETAVSGIEIPMWQHWKERFLQALVRWYPWIHATNEGVTFVYQLLYLLDATGFYTPALHISGIHVRRASGQELVMEPCCSTL